MHLGQLFLNVPRLRFYSAIICFLFRVLLNSGNWRRDTTLRIECIYNNTECCRNVLLDSKTRVGPGSRYQSNLLGNYTATNLHNGRFLYTRDIGKERCIIHWKANINFPMKLHLFLYSVYYITYIFERVLILLT